MSDVISTTAAAALLGCKPWQVRRLFERGRIVERYRVSGRRIILPEQLPVLRRLLIEAGFLRAA
jgi:hypothetical protein